MAKIFVLDDSRSVLEMVVQMLKKAGYEVLSSSSGKELFKTLRRQHVDLLITDIYMPIEDGLEVLVKARREHPGVKFIAMSSMTGPMNMLPVAKLLGAAVTLQKPFTEEALITAVAKVLGPETKTPAR